MIPCVIRPSSRGLIIKLRVLASDVAFLINGEFARRTKKGISRIKEVKLNLSSDKFTIKRRRLILYAKKTRSANAKRSQNILEPCKTPKTRKKVAKSIEKILVSLSRIDKSINENDAKKRLAIEPKEELLDKSTQGPP